MTISSAALFSIAKLRRPQWRHAHIELYLTYDVRQAGRWGEADTQAIEEGASPGIGPYARLYDPPTHLALGYEWNSFQMVAVSDLFAIEDWEEWRETEAYRKEWQGKKPNPNRSEFVEGMAPQTA